MHSILWFLLCIFFYLQSYSSEGENENKNNSDESEKNDKTLLHKILSTFKLKSLASKFKEQNDSILFILSEDSVKNSLRHLRCRFYSLSWWLSILNMWIEWKLLETLYVSYVGILSDCDNDLIVQAKKSIILYWDNIRSITIEKDSGLRSFEDTIESD